MVKSVRNKSKLSLESEMLKKGGKRDRVVGTVNGGRHEYLYISIIFIINDHHHHQNRDVWGRGDAP